MKYFQVLCLASIVCVALVTADLKTDIEEKTKGCMQEFNISPNILNLNTTVDEATEDLKCFAKCAINGSGVLNAAGELDVDKIVEIAVAFGQEESKARASGENCKALYKPNSTCKESYIAYVCSVRH